MKQAVKDAFLNFTTRFEGYVPFMYLDVKCLVTTGIGNLIDPLPAALALPWLKGTTPATQAEIEAEWQMVKSRTDLAPKGGGHFALITTLRLSRDGIQTLCWQRLATNEALTRTYHPGWDDFPADAQLGILSMDWAMGAGFHFPQFRASANAGDWSACVTSSHINTAGNPGVVPRNAANAILFANAAKVVADPDTYDPEKLYWPQAL